MVTTRKGKARVTTTSHRQPPQDPMSPRIPPRFVKLQGSKLSEVVTLETPVGFKRFIKLKRIGEEIWFHKGWTEFAEAHSIKEGYFLMFEYKGKSSFRVIIFDVSASEIKYPLDAVHISDNDDEVNEVTDKEFLGTQCTRKNDEFNSGDSEHPPKKTPRDIDFDKILHELDMINSVQVLKEEEEDKRIFKG